MLQQSIASARLKFGMKGTRMKSLTFPSSARSQAFEVFLHVIGQGLETASIVFRQRRRGPAQLRESGAEERIFQQHGALCQKFAFGPAVQPRSLRR